MIRTIFIGFLALSLLSFAAVASAQSESAPTLQVVEDEALGAYLTDGEGRSLYLTLEDAPGEGGCGSSCATYWPAFESTVLPEAGDGLDASLVSIREDDEHGSQVVFADWPLYYFAHDRGAGMTRGHRNADTWYLISPSGEPLGLDDEQEEPETEEGAETAGGEGDDAADARQEEDPELAALMAEGEVVFARVCTSCHGPGGEGGVGARLIENPRLADAESIAEAVTHGLGYMPALGDQMTAEETAAVLSFVRNSWGNDYGIVPVDLVEEVRQ